MAEQTDYKRIPYGISDFRQVREEGKYYVDKTMYLARMEEVGKLRASVRRPVGRRASHAAAGQLRGAAPQLFTEFIIISEQLHRFLIFAGQPTKHEKVSDPVI